MRRFAMDITTLRTAVLTVSLVVVAAMAEPVAPHVTTGFRSQPQDAELTELQYFGAAQGRRPVLAWQLRQEEEGQKEREREGAAEDAGGSGPVDSVVVNQPPPGASVAEARPVALSIAGAGGVAAARPQGTAVVGPGGLAVARPIATAIAGVPPGALLAGGASDGAYRHFERGRAPAVAVGPGLAGPKYSVLPAEPAAVAPTGHGLFVYVPVYVR